MEKVQSFNFYLTQVAMLHLKYGSMLRSNAIYFIYFPSKFNLFQISPLRLWIFLIYTDLSTQGFNIEMEISKFYFSQYTKEVMPLYICVADI